MNGSTARNLRKLIARNSNLPALGYTEEAHSERLVQVGVNLDGSPKLVPHTPKTTLLGECQRYYYQRAKTLHHLYQG